METGIVRPASDIADDERSSPLPEIKQDELSSPEVCPYLPSTYSTHFFGTAGAMCISASARQRRNMVDAKKGLGRTGR